MPDATSDPLRTVRRLLQAILAIGLGGTALELVLLEHYEEAAQLLPLAIIAVALAVLAMYAAAPAAGVLRLFRLVMVVQLLLGGVGVVLHYRGSLEFQRDMDPTASSWQLFSKSIRAKAPPALAPGVLVQLALLGLVSTYRDPASAGAAHGKEATS
jgi:hypothetical protein